MKIDNYLKLYHLSEADAAAAPAQAAPQAGQQPAEQAPAPQEPETDPVADITKALNDAVGKPIEDLKATVADIQKTVGELKNAKPAENNNGNNGSNGDNNNSDDGNNSDNSDDNGNNNSGDGNANDSNSNNGDQQQESLRRKRRGRISEQRINHVFKKVLKQN